MLKAYFDESGHGQKPVFVLGGFLSTTERWAAFEDDWREALDQLPARKRNGRKSLKMASAMSTRKRSPKGRAMWDDRLGRFQDIINKHVIFGVACVVDYNWFEALLKSRDDLVIVDHIYELAFPYLIGQVTKYYKKFGLNDKIEFVFDEQMHLAEQVARSFANMRSRSSGLFDCVAGSPSWASDDEVLPLQAAEWLVWQLRKNYADRCSEPNDDLFVTQDRRKADIPEIPIYVELLGEIFMRNVRESILDDRRGSILSTDSLPDDMRKQLLSILDRKV